MCLTAACGIFWQKDVPLQKLSCPCGHQYWDFFQERFVNNGRDRRFDTNGRALPTKIQEAEVKANMSPEAFEASIRAQFIVHCLGCGIRRRIDDGEAEAGFDNPSFLRAMAELQEIANGNYTSRGRATTFQEVPTALPIRPQEASRQQRQSRLSDPRGDPGPRDVYGEPLQTPASSYAEQTSNARRSAPVAHSDHQSLRPIPRDQQGLLLTRISSVEGGSTTSNDSQRGGRRDLPSVVTSSGAGEPDDRDRSSRTTRTSGESATEMQSRNRSSRHTPRHSAAREGENARDAGAPSSSLSPLLTKFVAFSDNQYDSIASFCKFNPAIWEEDPSVLRTLTRNGLDRGDTDRARRLAQRFLMLNLSWRRSKTTADQQRWLSKLGQDTSLQDQLEEHIDILIARLEQVDMEAVERF